MKNQYKDVRSVRGWLNKLEASGSKDDKVTLFTLTSLTPEKISETIREHRYDLNDPSLPEWLKQHYTVHRHPIAKQDTDDKRLISIILFVINHILESKYFARKSYDKATDAVFVSTEILREFYDDGKYISHVVAVGLAANILAKVSGQDTGFHHSKRSDVSAAEPATKHSRSFMIHPYHLRDEGNFLERVGCPDPLVARKIRKREEEEDELPHRFSEIRKTKVRLLSFFYSYNLRADYNAALASLQHQQQQGMAALPNKRVRNADTMDTIQLRYFSSILALKRVCSDNLQDKILKADKNGRLHSNLSSFPSILRKHLSFIGCDEPMAMVDMANAQPFLVLFLVMERFSQKSGKKIDTRKKLERYCSKNGYQDVMRYVNIVENGEFYKECYRLLKGNKKLRDITPDWKERVREMIYTSLFFGDGTTKWRAAVELRERFRQEYPTVYRIIDHYRSPDHLNFSNRLQQEESKLFIDDILSKLIVREKRPYILSLHDGVYCPESEIPAVRAKFERAFAKSQFQVRLKVDHYATGETNTIIINEHKT